jgi:hypothetical protein
VLGSPFDGGAADGNRRRGSGIAWKRPPRDALATCIDWILAKLRDAKPEMGKTVAIDGSDLPAYANGQRFVRRGVELRKRFADLDAS